MRTSPRSIPQLAFALTTLIVGLTSVGVARAQRVSVDAALAQGVLPADVALKTYLRIRLTGHRPSFASRRAGLNIAIVIDKSEAMGGGKISQIKAAVGAALTHVAPDDVVSVVAYDSTVEVLVPSTRAFERERILAGIDRLRASGEAALFAGASKGAAEVRKFIARDRVNRVILLSASPANVGPATAGDLAHLGAQLAREGIGVTTVGIGAAFDEDLMVALAERSGGNHYFVDRPSGLRALFDRGFAGLTSIVAQELELRVTFAAGVRPLRALGVDARVSGQTLRVGLPQLYADQREFVVVELAVDSLSAGLQRVARVQLSYRDAATRAVDRAEFVVNAEVSGDVAAAEASVNPRVMVVVAERLAAQRSRQALSLRDEGRVDEAGRLLGGVASTLRQEAARWGAAELKALAHEVDADAAALRGARWGERRKLMVERLSRPYERDEVSF